MHKPVLLNEVIKYLDPKPNENFIDCTFGQGGHSLEILKYNGPNGRVLGIEQDSEIVKNFKQQDRLILVNDSYVNLKKIVRENNFKPVNGILLDLGMSSWHLEESGRGFSFQKDEPLDMRYVVEANSEQRTMNNDLTAEFIVNEYSQSQLEEILKEYGEEKFAKRIAKEIVEQRKIKPLKTTFQLDEIIKKAVPFKKSRIHPATRTFQALRIAVNDELNNIEKVLPQANDVLSKGGRLAVISFHSLEDRITKSFLRDNKNLKILTKKPISAALKEIKDNPRARSAKLRVGIRL